MPTPGRVRKIILIGNILTILFFGLVGWIQAEWESNLIVAAVMIAGEWLLLWLSFKWAARLYRDQ